MMNKKTEKAIKELKKLQKGNDKEANHGDADNILLGFAPVSVRKEMDKRSRYK